MRILAFIEGEEVIEKILKHLGLWSLKVIAPPKVKAPSVTISSMIQIQRFHFLPSLLSGPRLPDGLQEDFEATLGDSDGYDFGYLSSVSDTSRKPRSDFHIFTWDT